MKIFWVAAFAVLLLSAYAAFRKIDRGPIQESGADVSGHGTRSARGSSPAKVTLSKENNLSMMRQLVKELQAKENLSYAQACNELSIRQSEGKTHQQRIRVFHKVFGLISSNPDDLAAIMGDLPSGELRRTCVTSINVKNTTFKTLKKIYQTMSESSDRNRIVEYIAEWSFRDGGIRAALEEIENITSDREKFIGVEAVADNMLNHVLWKSREIKVSEIEELRNYSKKLGLNKVGTDRIERTLNRIVILQPQLDISTQR